MALLASDEEFRRLSGALCLVKTRFALAYVQACFLVAGAVFGSVLASDSVLLRCTEGDATITVKKEEAKDTFLCPKHSTPMEPVAQTFGSGIHVIREGDPHEH